MVRQTEDKPRFAVVISKKTAKSAVTRNRIRRRVFELLRTHLDQFPAGFDGVLTIYDEQVANMPASVLKQDFEKMLVKTQAKSGSKPSAHPKKRDQ